MRLTYLVALLAVTLCGPATALAEPVQSSTSAFVSLRDCIARDTACDTINESSHERQVGGQPGGQEAEARLDDPDYGATRGSARLSGAPWAVTLDGSVRSLAGKRNASNSYALQRYSNDTAAQQYLALSITRKFKQSVPEENARFPAHGGAQTRSILRVTLFRAGADAIDLGSSAMENFEALMEVVQGRVQLDSVSNLKTALIRTGEGEETLWLDAHIQPGDSVWMLARLQVFAANGAAAEASVTTRFEVDGPDRSLEKARQTQGGHFFMTHPRLIGILGLLAIAACWSLAVVLFRTGAPGTMSRKLAVLLIFEGLTLFTAGFPQYVLGIQGQFSLPFTIAQSIIHWLGDGVMLALYPPFLAAALLTGLTRPFARKGVRIFLWVYGIGVVLASIGLRAGFGSQAGTLVLYVSMMLLFVFALVAAIDAWRRAEPGLARTRAKIFVLAFGIRDLSWGFVYGASVWMHWTNSFTGESDLFWQVKFVYALGTLIAVPLIAYGILRSQLFDIDLKVRWTIKQSTFAAAVLLITFAVSEGIEMLVSAELGDKWGLVAAGIAVVFLKPLQAFAERVVALVMPNTVNTPDYKNARKAEVYEVAFAEAVEEDGVSAKERALLNRLRDSLELSPEQASDIEKQVLS